MKRFTNVIAVLAATAGISAWAQDAQPDIASQQNPPPPPPGAGPGQFQGQQMRQPMQQGRPWQGGGMHQMQQQQGAPAGGMQPGLLPQPQNGPPSIMPAEDDFFPPELIMRVQQGLGLTDDQRNAIRKEMQESVSQFTDLQWQESAAHEKFATLSKGETIDEEKTLAQLDELLKIENSMKRMQARMMIRIRNVLTPAQRTQLREIKRGEMSRMMMRDMPRSDQDNARGLRQRDIRNGPQGMQDQEGPRGRLNGFGQRPMPPQGGAGAPQDAAPQ